MSSKRPLRERMWDTILITLSVLLVALLLGTAGYHGYRGVTDIEYRVGYRITELAQCSGGDTHSTSCIAKAGRVIVRMDRPMYVGMNVWKVCYIETNGRDYCVKDFEYRRAGKLTRKEALLEYSKRNK
ncbi:hypothetical protein VPHD148_0073 [Vibrio phage D148]